MDFGGVGLDGLVVCSASDTSLFPSSSLDPDNKLKWYGSGFLKQERPAVSEDDWRDLKLAKTADDLSASKPSMLLGQRGGSLMARSNGSLVSDGQQMLSFSSPNSQTSTMPYYYHHHTPSAGYGRNTGYGSGGLNVGGSMHGVLTGVRGPFTPSQWMELEHQALIYKYITANAPIPSNLLIPIRKALESAGLSTYSGGYLRPNTLGWGAFHMGFSNNTDPEPGRCRRTDGKKWRCSRDAVADQKYCERHMNRGRHRSRKPVEGLSGHSVPGPTTTATAKLMPMSSSASLAAAAVVPGGGSSNSLGLSNQNHLNNLQSGVPNPSASPHLNRSFLNKANVGEKVQDTTGLSMLSPAMGLKGSQFSISKQPNTYDEPSRAEFGLVCSDSLLNPLHKSYGASEDRENTKSNHSLRQFMDDWPKNPSERASVFWPDINPQSDRTQLSISIPMASSDFMSSTSSPTNEKLALSPLKLSRELDPTQMGLGLGGPLNEPNLRQANWIPISWETSMGGPLGEVLHSTSSSAGDCTNTSALNLMTEGWDHSPRVASSPTGVLQKTTFRSLSNSSAGSSPRTENKAHEGGSICNNLLGSNILSSMPAS